MHLNHNTVRREVTPPTFSALDGLWTEIRYYTYITSFYRHARRCGAVGWGTALQSGRSRVRFGIFHWHNPVGRTMALGSTQPLTEMSTRNISCGVKAAGAYDWQPYHLHMPIVVKSGCPDLLEPSGPVQACNGTALPLYRHFRCTATNCGEHSGAVFEFWLYNCLTSYCRIQLMFVYARCHRLKWQ
jgi:hypothetical protein